MRRTSLLLVAASLSLSCLAIACGADCPPLPAAPPPPPPMASAPAPVPPPPPAAMNPFLHPSTLAYQAPPFDQIHDGDFQPAIEDAMKDELVHIDVIAGSAEPPTFENTIVAMERTGQYLARGLKVFGAMGRANTNDTLRKG